MKLLACLISTLMLYLVAPTTAIAAEKDSITIGFGSCYGEPRDELWKELEAQQFDAFLFLGDNIYLPSSWSISKKTYDQYYQRLFTTPSFQRFIQSTYELPIWDDHDYGPDNGDSSFANSAIARNAFRKYWNVPKRLTVHPKGLYRSAEVGSAKILLTDNRSFRVSSGPATQQALFGEEQLAWIEREVAASASYSLVILASGNQLLTSGRNHEHLAQYPKEYQRLIQALATSPTPVLIASGDRHFGDIIDRELSGRRLIEATSSPLSGNMTGPSIVWPQVGRRRILVGTQNFGRLTIFPSDDSVQVLIELVSSRDGEPLRRYRVEYVGSPS